jgi:hypothetical protein
MGKCILSLISRLISPPNPPEGDYVFVFFNFFGMGKIIGFFWGDGFDVCCACGVDRLCVCMWIEGVYAGHIGNVFVVTHR